MISRAKGNGCEAHEKLRTTYKAFLADYMRSVQALDAFQGKMSDEEFRLIVEGLERARERWSEARLALGVHIVEHGCTGD